MTTELDEPRGEYAQWVAAKPERIAAIRAYLDMLDAAEDRREDAITFWLIAMGVWRL